MAKESLKSGLDSDEVVGLHHWPAKEKYDAGALFAECQL